MGLLADSLRKIVDKRVEFHPSELALAIKWWKNGHLTVETVTHADGQEKLYKLNDTVFAIYYHPLGGQISFEYTDEGLAAKDELNCLLSKLLDRYREYVEKQQQASYKAFRESVKLAEQQLDKL